MTLLTFPLPLDQFFDLLPVETLTFDPSESVEIDETGGGEVLKATLGPDLWQGQLDLTVMTWDEAFAITPMINVLRRAGASFLVADPRRPWPRLDPEGAILGQANVQISAIGSSMREIALKGLPARYLLSRGDLLSFPYGIPSRYALHEIVGPTVADTNGETTLFEVTPPIRSGAAVNAPVQLIWPRCKAVLRGGASTGKSGANATRDASISWTQTLR